MARLFVAAWPPAEVCDALEALEVARGDGVRPVAPENWHVTLRFLGDVDAGEAIELLTDAELPHANVRLGPQVERLDRRQIVVPASGADELADAVDRTLDGFGERRRHRFRGHLTVARTRPDAVSDALGRPIDTTFDVEAVLLVESDLRPQGVRYTTVAGFPTVRRWRPGR